MPNDKHTINLRIDKELYQRFHTAAGDMPKTRIVARMIEAWVAKAEANAKAGGVQ